MTSTSPKKRPRELSSWENDDILDLTTDYTTGPAGLPLGSPKKKPKVEEKQTRETPSDDEEGIDPLVERSKACLALSDAERVAKLRKAVLEHVVKVKKTVPINAGGATVTLNCYEWARESKGKQTGSITVKGLDKPFKSIKHSAAFNLSGYYAKGEGLTASHLCHNDKCCNPRHVVFEPLAVNKGRNGCAGPAACNHKPKCLRLGTAYSNFQAVACPEWAAALFEL